ncbi:MAG: EAL domain-containing protein [Nakamurella sp.]
MRRGIVSGMHPKVVWQHPRLGLLGPSDFTLVAEEVGVMPAILDWAVHEICDQARTWRGAGNSDFFIGFDLSARQISYPSFVSELSAAMRSRELAGFMLNICVLPPGRIAPTDDEVLLRALDALRSLGIAVGVNGCGAESSVLSWLADIPFDTFKIAPHFGSAIGVKSRTDHMVSSLVTMSHDMGMTVAIDGIFTPAQRSRAMKLGCDFAEGALFGELAPPPPSTSAPLLEV